MGESSLGFFEFGLCGDSGWVFLLSSMVGMECMASGVMVDVGFRDSGVVTGGECLSLGSGGTSGAIVPG